MALEDILKRSAYRRSFYIIFLLLILALVLARYFVLPLLLPQSIANVSDASSKLLESLVVSLLVTVGIGSFIFWLLPDFEEIAKVNIIGSEEISKYLERAMDETDIWWYMGSTGRYLRSDALKGITAAVRNGGGGCHIIALLLDPTNEKLCERFAQYRQSLKASGRGPWTSGRVKTEVLATILRTLIVKDKQPQLRIDIGLRDTFSTLRYDVSSKYVIISKEEADAPGIRCDAPGYYYKSYRAEVTFAYNQARPVTDPPNGFSAELDRIDADGLKKLFEKLDVRVTGITDEELAEIIKIVKDPHNPYEE